MQTKQNEQQLGVSSKFLFKRVGPEEGLCETESGNLVEHTCGGREKLQHLGRESNKELERNWNSRSNKT